jgi:hypothetical protein
VQTDIAELALFNPVRLPLSKKHEWDNTRHRVRFHGHRLRRAQLETARM